MQSARTAVVAIVALGASCSPVRVKEVPDRITGFTYLGDDASTRRDASYRAFQDRFSREWSFHRSRPDRPPEYGVAFSGGGMRSAAFSIGVMQGLRDVEWLKRCDVMSAVSGGSYALSWYYVQQFRLGGADDSILDHPPSSSNSGSTGIHQCHLVDHADELGVIRYLKGVASDSLAIPINLLCNGVFGWHTNTSPARWQDYEVPLSHEFHDAPACLGPPDFVKDGPSERSADISFADLCAFARRERLPYFIIDATARIDDDEHHFGSRLANAVFEMTPLFWGSDAFGVYEDHFPFGISKAVSISGAAWDGPSALVGGTKQMIASAFNQDLGYFIDNPNASGFETILYRCLPIPFYVASPLHDFDTEGLRVYLSDGGFSDNLGGFSLIRRLCRRMVFVDAVHDPDFRFEPYRKLRGALRAEFGVDVRIPLLDPLLADLNGSVTPGDGRTAQNSDAVVARRKLVAEHPVLTGYVGPFHAPEDWDREQLDLVYVKLSLDETRINDYPEAVRDYFLSKEQHGFPQEPTSDQSYSRAQFMAYRDLGFHIVTTNEAAFRQQEKPLAPPQQMRK